MSAEISSYLVLPDGTTYEGTLSRDGDGRPIVEVATCGTCGFRWNDALCTDITPVPSGRCPNEYGHRQPLARRHFDSSCWQDLGEVDPYHPGELIAHVWPGGYPVVYVDPEDDGEGLCAETVRGMIEAGEWPDGRSVDSFTHYEGDPFECTCGKMIESAYGNPGAREPIYRGVKVKR
jgi:hypothetical protein